MAQKCNPLTDFKDFHFFKIEPGGFFVIKNIYPLAGRGKRGFDCFGLDP